MPKKPAKTSNARVFLLDGGASPFTTPAYEPAMKLGSVTMALGDITPIYKPDPSRYGRFIEVDSISGTPERATATLTGIYPRNVVDDLLRIAREGCEFDLQLHYGVCQDPSNPNTFDKAVVLEGVRPTQYNTDDLGALTPDDNAQINTGLEISAREVYEVVPIDFAQHAASLIDTDIVDIIAPNVSSCGGDCEDAGKSTDFILALKQSDAGQVAAVVYTVDGGTNWHVSPVSSQAGNNLPVTAIGALSDYIVVFEGANVYHYAERSDFDGVATPTWVSVTITSGSFADAFSVSGYAFAVGDDGSGAPLMLKLTGADAYETLGVNATGNPLTAVHALSTDFLLVGGTGGVVVYSKDGGESFIAATPIPSGANVASVWAKSESLFIVSDVSGNLYASKDTGKTWTSIRTFTGGAYVTDSYFATNSIGYFAVSDGRLYRTYDGGKSMVRMPDGSSTMPSISTFEAVYGAPDDVNFAVCGGSGGLVIGKA